MWSIWGGRLGKACVALTLMPRFTGVGSVESRSHVRRVAHACSGDRSHEPVAPSLSRFWDYLWCKCCPGAFSAPSGRTSPSTSRRPIGLRAEMSRRRRPRSTGGAAFVRRELTKLIEEAQTANLDIGAAIGRIMQADAQSKIAGAPLLPAAGFRRQRQRSKPPGGVERDTYRVALNAAYEIDFWGKNRAASRAAQETAVATRFDKEVVVLSTIASVGTAYFQVLSSQDRLRIARQNIDAANRVLTLIKQRFDAGTASPLDVAQQESLVATLRAAIPPLDQTLRQNIAVLAVLIGRAPADLTVKGGSLYRLTIPRVTPGLPSELLFQRPDIRAAEANLASADASVESARAAFFPEHLADRPGRLRKHGAQAAVHAADRLLQPRRQHRAAAARRLPAGGPAGTGQGPAIRAAQGLLPDHPRRLPRRGDRADRHRRQHRARASAARRGHQLAPRLRARRDQVARGHRRSRHRAADPADPVHGRRQSRDCTARAPAGRVESLSGARRQLAAAAAWEPVPT